MVAFWIERPLPWPFARFRTTPGQPGASAGPSLWVLFDPVRAGHHRAGDDGLHGAPGFLGRFSLHGYSLHQTAVRIGDAVASCKGRANQGEGQGSGKSKLLHFITYARKDGFCWGFVL